MTACVDPNHKPSQTPSSTSVTDWMKMHIMQFCREPFQREYFFLSKRWTEEITGSIIDGNGFDVHLNGVQALKRSRLLHTSLIFMCSWLLVLLQPSGLGKHARSCSYIYSFGWHLYSQQLNLRQNTHSWAGAGPRAALWLCLIWTDVGIF